VQCPQHHLYRIDTVGDSCLAVPLVKSQDSTSHRKAFSRKEDRIDRSCSKQFHRDEKKSNLFMPCSLDPISSVISALCTNTDSPSSNKRIGCSLAVIRIWEEHYTESFGNIPEIYQSLSDFWHSKILVFFLHLTSKATCVLIR
jgi:hypothetical protein